MSRKNKIHHFRKSLLDACVEMNPVNLKFYPMILFIRLTEISIYLYIPDPGFVTRFRGRKLDFTWRPNEQNANLPVDENNSPSRYQNTRPTKYFSPIRVENETIVACAHTFHLSDTVQTSVGEHCLCRLVKQGKLNE